MVRVRDLSNNRGPSSGKQRLARGGIWYTAQSGIWQTVWLEAVPRTYVERLVLVPQLDEGAVDVLVVPAGDGRAVPDHATVRVLADGAVVGEGDGGTPAPRCASPLSDVRPWSPEDPHLYDVEVELGEDRVRSYVGLRSFGVGTGDDGVPRLLLNGRALPAPRRARPGLLARRPDDAALATRRWCTTSRP